MKGWVDDFVGAWRSLRRHPRYAAVVVVTLTLGVGVTSTIFGVARDVLLRPFPYPDADRVVAVASYDVDRPDELGNVTYPNLTDLAASVGSVESIGLARWWTPALEDEGGALVVRGATVTSNFFSILGVEAGVGRFFYPDEQGAGREPVVVLSHALWLERFGADPAAVGSVARLNGTPYRIIGVTSPSFEDPWLLGGPGAEPLLWRTVDSPPSDWPRSGRSWRGIGRVSSQASLDQARIEVGSAFERLAEAWPDHNANKGMALVPLRERVSGPSRPVLMVLAGAVGLLLLIACANLTNLMLGRAIDREGEVKLHRALGASGARIVRRSLAEVALLGAVGGALGLGLAVLLGEASRAAGRLMPRPVSGEVDVGIVLFAVLVTTGAAALFGLLPSLQALRSSRLGGADLGRRTAGRGREGLRRGLVVGQIAVSCVLLVACGLLGRSLHRLGAVELGVLTEQVYGVELHGSAWYDLNPVSAERQWASVLDAVRAVPGVTHAGAIDYLPLSDNYSCDGVHRTDRPEPPGEGQCAEVRVVLPGALSTMGIELVRGRLMERSDGVDQPPVVVIDEALARAMWPGEDPLGQGIEVHIREHEVVGIVRDMKHFGPGEQGPPMLYLHAPQEGWNGITRGLSLVYATTDASVDISSVRSAVHSVNPAIALGPVQPFEQLLSEHMAAPRFRTVLMAAFAGAAALLAALGIGGVLLFSVARRSRELGVRLALGARPPDVRWLVMREGALLVGLGLVFGFVGAAGAGRILESMLFEVTARDPWVFLAVAVALCTFSLIASWVPAHRASRVDPIQALGSDSRA